MKRKQIIKVFADLKKLKVEGIWFSGIEGEGKYKQWHPNGQLWIHSHFKNDKLEGEYKQWHDNGQLFIHCNYNDKYKLEGIYKEWYKNGQLYREGIAIGGDYYNPTKFKPGTLKEYDKKGNLK